LEKHLLKTQQKMLFLKTENVLRKNSRFVVFTPVVVYFSTL